MKRAHRQEKLLSSTLTESLILFLFILLAIADIYKKREKQFLESGIIPPNHKVVPEGAKTIKENQIGIDENEYDELLTELVEKTKEIGKFKNEKKKFDSLGVSCPPCKLPSGENFILFDVDYLADTIYVLTMKNISKPESFKLSNGKYVKINKNEKIYLKHRDFIRWADAKIASKRIHQDDDYCKKGTNAQKQSAWCLECQYVFRRISIKEKQSFSFLAKNGKVDKELAIFMHNAVLNRFYRK